jgi:hypothetical protein
MVIAVVAVNIFEREVIEKGKRNFRHAVLSDLSDLPDLPDRSRTVSEF